MGRIALFMKNRRKPLLLILLLAAVFFALHVSGLDKYLDFAYVSKQRSALLAQVMAHYWPAVAVFIVLYVSTAFIVPGALVLTLAGGFLFGVLPATLYVNVGSTLGAVLALLVSRHMAGSWIQKKYAEQLEPLNRAVERHSVSYLLALRIVPVLPFFAVNYLAGLSRIPMKTYIWTTSLGTIPGSLIYAYAGRQLGSISRPADVFSPKILATLALLTLFTLLPPIFDWLRRRRGRK